MNGRTLRLFEDFDLDLERGCLRQAGRPVHLRPQSYEVLLYLAEHRGQLVKKDRLIDTVWQGRAVTDDALVQCLMEVRQALGAKGKLYVRNVRGRGYIFDPQDEDVAPPDEGSIGAPGTLDPEVLPASRPTRRTLLVAANLVIAASVAAVAYVSFANRSSAITSIAVLPFENAGSDPQTEYISDGLSDSLIVTLSQLPQLKVIARSSAFKYKGKEVDLQEVGSTLSVDAVLLGRVVQRGNELMVSAELVDARQRTQLWGGQYVHEAADLQTVQQEIVQAIGQQMRLRLSGASRHRLATHATQDSRAYQSYLNGLYYRRKGGFENVRKALDYFNQAVALDANFARAWIGVAQANRYFSGNSLVDPKEPLARARAATGKALELDPLLAEAHIELAGLKRDEWDWIAAEREYKRAIGLNPNLVDAHTSYASFLSCLGRHAEALASIRRAQQLDPLETGLRGLEGWFLSLARRYDEAIVIFRERIARDPRGSGARHTSLGLAYEAKGMYEQAISEYRETRSIDGDTTWHQIILGYALAMSGNQTHARAILHDLQRSAQYVSPAELAILQIGLGEKEAALALLEKAYAAHDLQLQYLKVDSHYDAVRSDPRFRDLVRRVGLPG